MGADRLGRDVLAKAIKGTEISVFVGVMAALVATLIGTLLGALSGYFGGKVGDFPRVALQRLHRHPEHPADLRLRRGLRAAAWTDGGADPGLTGWTGLYRQVRAEFIKHRGREYVRAAEAIGASVRQPHLQAHPAQRQPRDAGAHVAAGGGLHQERGDPVLPGPGRAVDQVSWGTMLAEAQSELILGHWWQLAARPPPSWPCSSRPSRLMADALRDALDPKLRGVGLE
jgi:peptide/nickel transport system permease protein